MITQETQHAIAHSIRLVRENQQVQFLAPVIGVGYGPDGICAGVRGLYDPHFAEFIERVAGWQDNLWRQAGVAPPTPSLAFVLDEAQSRELTKRARTTRPRPDGVLSELSRRNREKRLTGFMGLSATTHGGAHPAFHGAAAPSAVLRALRRAVDENIQKIYPRGVLWFHAEGAGVAEIIAMPTRAPSCLTELFGAEAESTR